MAQLPHPLAYDDFELIGGAGTRRPHQRWQAFARMLATAGEKVTARTVKRKRQRYEAQGLAGLVDGRADRTASALGRTDERVLHERER